MYTRITLLAKNNLNENIQSQSIIITSLFLTGNSENMDSCQEIIQSFNFRGNYFLPLSKYMSIANKAKM